VSECAKDVVMAAAMTETSATSPAAAAAPTVCICDDTRHLRAGTKERANVAHFRGHLLSTCMVREAVVATSLRAKLIKIGAKVVSHGRYVTFQKAEIALSRNVSADIRRNFIA
jgi:hypothetical protein